MVVCNRQGNLSTTHNVGGVVRTNSSRAPFYTEIRPTWDHSKSTKAMGLPKL